MPHLVTHMNVVLMQKINNYINSEMEKYPNVKQRAHICKWLETTSTVIFNENCRAIFRLKMLDIIINTYDM